MTEPVHVVGETERAQVLLHPTRLRILELLVEPASAASLAPRLDLPRQLVNYHLHELAAQGLVTLAEKRSRGSVTERVYRRAGDSYAIAPQALGQLAPMPERIHDRFSSAYQVALAHRVLQELADLRIAATAADKALPTFSLEVDVRFADAAARNAFAQDLADAVAALVRRHHDAIAPRGRTFRFYLGGYPRPKGRPATHGS